MSAEVIRLEVASVEPGEGVCRECLTALVRCNLIHLSSDGSTPFGWMHYCVTCREDR